MFWWSRNFSTFSFEFIIYLFSRSMEQSLSFWQIDKALLKVIYPQYYKHCLSTVVHTIDCLCGKILNHGRPATQRTILKTVGFHIEGPFFILQKSFTAGVWYMKLSQWGEIIFKFFILKYVYWSIRGEQRFVKWM